MKHYALIGDPVGHSLSPAIYGFLFEKYGIDADFSLIRLPKGRAGDAVCMGLDGFACTMPHKQDIIPFLSALSPDAAAMGSVNIVNLEEHGYIGYSTDGEGLLSAIRPKHAAVGQNVFIIGSGGAARSAAYSLAKQNSVTLFARNEAAAINVAAAAGACWRPLSHLTEDVADCDILINATPLGMSGCESFNSLAFLQKLNPSALVCDMVYMPRETELLKAARALGIDTVEGIEMLIGQGLAAFAIWTGILPSDLLKRDLYIKICK